MADSQKYNIIYADPPWRYEQRSIQGGAEQHYPTMTLDDICKLPVAELADKDCALFLWTTFPKLKEAFQVMDANRTVRRIRGFTGWGSGRGRTPRYACSRSRDARSAGAPVFISL